jgi:2-polyprenyl-6-methoxyphenol hydroxylase-like FAD-dependent oxidoreductase
MREEQTDVLIVGAGPVGLTAALTLAEVGIEVTIIDREDRTAARSYACALHPTTLKLLQRLNLLKPVLDLGRRVETIAFYDGAERRAEVKMSDLGGEFPFLLILPQGSFEKLLEDRLRSAGVAVQWKHRLDSLETQSESVEATVEEMAGTSTGYIVPHWETVVKRRSSLQAGFVIGADGANSLVCQRLGIEYERIAGPFFFAAYEFESDTDSEAEVRVVLDENTTNVLWPLAENKCRWTFQIVRTEIARDFPEKERHAVRLVQELVDDRIRQYVQGVTKRRAPWFSAGIKAVTWCTEVLFEHRVARTFGQGRCWLAGDAAHQTGPVGVQSMNAGLAEADALSGLIRKVLRENAPMETLADYDRQCRKRWSRLLGMGGDPAPSPESDAWVRQRAARLLPCLPGTGDDLVGLARQLKLNLA